MIIATFSKTLCKGDVHWFVSYLQAKYTPADKICPGCRTYAPCTESGGRWSGRTCTWSSSARSHLVPGCTTWGQMEAVHTCSRTQASSSDHWTRAFRQQQETTIYIIWLCYWWIFCIIRGMTVLFSICNCGISNCFIDEYSSLLKAESCSGQRTECYWLTNCPRPPRALRDWCPSPCRRGPWGRGNLHTDQLKLLIWCCPHYEADTGSTEWLGSINKW